MEKAKLLEIDYTDHESKCRICFKAFRTDKDRVKITKTIEEKFREVIQKKLKMSYSYSKEMCVTCSDQLNSNCTYRRNIIATQSKLYKIVLDKKKDQENFELLLVKDESEDEVSPVEFVIENPEKQNQLETPEADGLDSNSFQQLPEYDPTTVENHRANLQKRRQSGKLGLNNCPHCDVKIVVGSQMKRHIERVHFKIKNFKCDLCDYECYFKYALVLHMQKHLDRESRRKYVCDSCDHVTISKESLRGHKLLHQAKLETITYECPTCFEPFDTYNKLFRHKRTMHEEAEKYVCNYCNKSLKSASSLKNHISLFHTNQEARLLCPIADCCKVCFTQRQMNNHMKTHNDDTKVVCFECGLLVANRHNLEKHINRVHLNLRNFACDLCDYKGCFKFNIVDHMKKHLDISEREKHFCDEPGCSFQSVSKTSLRAHKNLEHLGKKHTFVCHCGKVFSQNSSYYTHVKNVHEKIKRHPCQLCPKAFFEKSELRNHVKSQHLKQKDLPCGVCQKMFATRKHLQSHMKYHEEPQFTCQFQNCSNAFYTPAQLNSHIKVHKGERDHQCHKCEKNYFHKSHLKKHLLTHGIE